MGSTTTTRMDSGFIAFVWRHRIGLAPAIAGILLAVIGSIVKLINFAPHVAIGIYLTISVVWLVANIDMQRSAGEIKVKRRQQNWFIGTVSAASLLWLIYYHFMSDTWLDVQNALLILLIGTISLGCPYWFDLRRRTRVKLDNMIDAWPGLVQGTSLAKSKMASFHKTANGWVGTLSWEKGALSRRRVKDEAELVESLTDAPPGSVVIETLEGKGNVNKVKITCIEDDPHTKPIVFDGEVATSIRDRVNLGKYVDHQEENSVWWENGVGGFHRLLAGATRTGKSGLTHLLVAKYGPADDTALWLADLKGGTALLPWSPMADWTVTTADDAVHMLQAGAKEVDRRAKVCASRGVEVWEPSIDEPVILLFFDEIASCIGDSAPNYIAQPARQAIVEIARKGAGMGVLLVPATQYPTLAALGDSQLKSQLAWRACFRLNQPEQGHFILPSMPKGVDPYRIPKSRRGTCYIDAEGEFRPAMLRVQFVDRPDIDNVVNAYGRRTLDDQDGPKFLDGIEEGWSSEELAEAYRSRTRWTIQDLETLKSGGSVVGSDATDDDLHDHEDAPTIELEDDDMDDRDDNVVAVDFSNELRKATDLARQDGSQMAEEDERERQAWLSARAPITGDAIDQTIMDALHEAGRDGVGPADLAAKTNRSERTMHRRLEKLRDSGTVTRLAWGKYALTVQPARR